MGFLFKPPKPEPLPAIPQAPDREVIQSQQRRRLSNTGVNRNIFTTPLGVQSNQTGNVRLGD